MVFRIVCAFLGHKLRYIRPALEGGKVFQCQRCGRWFWRTTSGWYDLGRD